VSFFASAWRPLNIETLLPVLRSIIPCSRALHLSSLPYGATDASSEIAPNVFHLKPISESIRFAQEGCFRNQVHMRRPKWQKRMSLKRLRVTTQRWRCRMLYVCLFVSVSVCLCQYVCVFVSVCLLESLSEHPSHAFIASEIGPKRWFNYNAHIHRWNQKKMTPTGRERMTQTRTT
jgi:hypothetical protein